MKYISADLLPKSISWSGMYYQPLV